MQTDPATPAVMLSDQEPFFIPHMAARLAKAGLLTAIVVRKPEHSFERRRQNLKRMLDSFGTAAVIKSAASAALAAGANMVFQDRYYSLRKVALRFQVPYHEVSQLYCPEFYDLITSYTPENAVSKKPVILSHVSIKLRPELLEKAHFIGRHCSPLPAYAGVNPVFWGLLNGEKELGVSIFEITEEYDAGQVLRQSCLPAKGHTFFSAYHALFDIAADLVIDYLKTGGHLKGTLSSTTREPSYYSWQSPEDRIEFLRKGYSFGVPFRLHPGIRPSNGK